MPELHLDIHEEILARSQVEDLIRCKRVCKSWNSLISSRRFVKSHLNYNSKNKAADTRIDLDGCGYRLVGSSNGLVCFYKCSYDDELLYVVNPSTREVKQVIPPEDVHIQVLGYGYDSSIDDFKVVAGFYNHEISDYNMFFQVLTLKSNNVWRSAGELEGRPLYKNVLTYGTLYNGVIHWLFYGNLIVTFDLSKEVIVEIPQPAPSSDRFQGCYRLQRYYYYTLGTIKDHLCIKYQKWHPVDKTEETELWVIKNYNVMKTEGIEMEQWLPPPGYDEHKKILENYTTHGIDGHVHIWMLEEGSGAVLVHSLESPHENSNINLFTISECNYNFHLPVFVKTLVSPHGMGGHHSGNGGDSEAMGC